MYDAWESQTIYSPSMFCTHFSVYVIYVPELKKRRKILRWRSKEILAISEVFEHCLVYTLLSTYYVISCTSFLESQLCIFDKLCIKICTHKICIISLIPQQFLPLPTVLESISDGLHKWILEV